MKDFSERAKPLSKMESMPWSVKRCLEALKALERTSFSRDQSLELEGYYPIAGRNPQWFVYKWWASFIWKGDNRRDQKEIRDQSPGQETNWSLFYKETIANYLRFTFSLPQISS